MGVPGTTGGVPSVAPTTAAAAAVTVPLTALQIAQMFRQADTDGDGVLTRAEALRLPLVTMSFEDMDTNRDGVVSAAEYAASLR
jgi:Ca2+-binding EF-hand superfamily protein